MYVGVDLAWGTTNRTGVAVVDHEGSLVESATLRLDEELDAWLARLEVAPSVIAIDAPLIVKNETGQRECEGLISRAFGRYNASCHTSNLRQSVFDPPRGAELAHRHGWTLDPSHRGSSSAPACIEVYPHPAMVGIFRLGSTLPYKARSGRGLAVRSAAFVELVQRMETLSVLELSRSKRWAELSDAVNSATRPVELERIEDEVDAIFCAHLAWLWQTDSDALVQYGTYDAGYIVAPPAPTHPASRRSPRVATARSRTVCDVDVLGPPASDSTAREAAWKAAIRAAVGQQVVAEGARLGITIDFRLASPLRASEAWDLDNLIKPTIDALDGVLGTRAIRGARQVDDERVDEIRATKRPVRIDEAPGARIILTLLEPI